MDFSPHLSRCFPLLTGYGRCSQWTPADTPHGLKPDGFSVHRPSQRRDSPKALSAPLDVSGCVLIAVHNQPTVGADMGTHAEALVYAFPTAATVLTGVRWIDRFHSLPGACCLESEDR